MLIVAVIMNKCVVVEKKKVNIYLATVVIVLKDIVLMSVTLSLLSTE